MIILEWSTSLFCSLSFIIEKTYFAWPRKWLNSFRLMFNNLIKLTKILTRENSMQQVLFHFSRSWPILRILVSIKNLEYKNFLLEKNLWRKKNILQKHSAVGKFFFRITMFSWWFSWLRIINVYQFSFP